MISPTILYQDDDVLILDKPAGIVVNRSHTSPDETVQDWIEKFLKKSKDSPTPLPVSVKNKFYANPESIFLERSGIAHRLDKETSGILVCAKHPTALIHLLQQFKQRNVKKTYTALVHGKVQPEVGEINLPIGRNTRFRLQYAVREDGKASQTSYQVQKFFPNLNTEKLIHKRQEHKVHTPGISINVRRGIKIYQGFSLVLAKPHTGRTHQIRVHFAHINHPLVGDATYAGKKRRVLDQIWCPRHFLHASALTFTHPRTGKTLTFSSPLPEDLQSAMGVLEG